MPVTKDQSGVGAQKAKFQAGKIERAHSAAIGVIFFVTRHNGVPATENAVTSGKSEVRGVPIAGQKCGDVAAIPGCLLGVEDRADGAAIRLAVLGFVSAGSGWR